MTSPFWTLHRDLPWEGPGEVADVVWAMGLAEVVPDAWMAMRRRDADAALSAVLDEAAAEADGWRRWRRETGDLLCVARPI